MKYNVEERLTQIMNDVAEEIRRNGKDSLYMPEQRVIGGRIVIDIDADCIPTIRYEKTVFPKGADKND